MEPARYRIRVRGELGTEWSAWFDGLDVTAEPDGDSSLTSEPLDQAALHGLLARIRDLGLPLLSVELISSAEIPTDAAE